MDAITIDQPFADLICSGIIDVINMNLPKFASGKLLIHSSGKIDKKSKPTPQQIMAIGDRKFDFKINAIIGEVTVLKSVENHQSIWAKQGMHHWIVTEAIIYKNPIRNVKGRGGLWDFDYQEHLKSNK